jgi:putative FmdB family regulatory protein
MPLYEFECIECYARVEKIMASHEDQNPPCERCGGAMRRLPSAPTPQFKGSGWAKDGYSK